MGSPNRETAAFEKYDTSITSPSATVFKRAAKETAFHSSLNSEELGKQDFHSWSFALCTLVSILGFAITVDAKYSGASSFKNIKGEVGLRPAASDQTPLKKSH